MNRILLLLGYILLLSAPVCGRGVGTRAVSDCDSLHTFRFVQGRDVLYADYQGNNHELKRLFAAVSSFRGPIADGKMRIYVDGHCTSGGSVHDNLWLAYVRSSRVKSELITRKGMKEEYFVTHNHAVCYPGEERDVVIVCLREPAGADTLSAPAATMACMPPDICFCLLRSHLLRTTARARPPFFLYRSVRPVIPVRLRGREQKIRVGWSSP